MPFIPIQESPLFAHRKKQKYLIVVLILVMVLIIFVLWRGFFGKGELPTRPATTATTPAAFKKVKINWQLLEDPRLENLISFEKTPAYEEEIGRENPFIPY